MTRFLPDPGLLDSPRHRPWPAALSGRQAARTIVPASSADVVIVGAGPAALAVASALWHRGIRDVLLLDREAAPMARFFRRIDVLRQRVLRSPYEHHPGVEGYRDCELLDFARLHWSRLTATERREVRMAQSGHRSVVPVDVFQAYCAQLAVTHRIAERTHRAEVHEIRPGPDSVTVRADGFAVTAGFVVLCHGEETRAAPASWSPLANQWDRPVPDGDELVVIGAGLTAAHLILNGLREGKRVHWVVRTEERYQCADVNAAFFRAEGRARFDPADAEPTPWEQRLALLRAHRRASVMFEFRPALRAAETTGRLSVHRGAEVDAVTGAAEVLLADGRVVTGDHLVLALGTTPSIGRNLLPDTVIGERDGWPDLAERTLAYRGAPRVFAVGAAAGMALGPAARNIDGHRVATARVAPAIDAGLRGGTPIEPVEPRDQVAAGV